MVKCNLAKTLALKKENIEKTKPENDFFSILDADFVPKFVKFKKNL